MINALNVYLDGFCNTTPVFVLKNVISQFIKSIRTTLYAEESVTLKLNTLIGMTIINAIDVMKVLLLLIIVSDVHRMERRSVVLNAQNLCSTIKTHINANKSDANSKEMTSHAINVKKDFTCFMTLRLVFLNALQTTLLMKISESVAKNANQTNMPDTMIRFV